MRVRERVIGGLCGAIAVAAIAAVAIAPAGAAPAPVTLGNTSGTANANLGVCPSSFNCTIVPFSAIDAPAIVVPSDGTITSFSVNSGSPGAPVQLRVLRPAGGGNLTGAGTSAAQTAGAGLTTFAVSMPVKAGDLLGLDNASDAQLFDKTSSQPVAAVYTAPALADGATAVPPLTQGGLRLLLSAVEQPTGTTTTTTSTTSTVTVTRTVTASGRAPTLGSVKQSASTWRESGRTLRHHPPIGTTFSFRLSAAGNVTVTFVALGRRAVARGTLTLHSRAGVNRVAFRGRSPRLGRGSYLAIFVAHDSAGRASAPSALEFTIAK